MHVVGLSVWSATSLFGRVMAGSGSARCFNAVM